MERNNLQPKKKILAKGTFFHLVSKILIGRRNNSDLNLNMMIRADGSYLSVLQYSQKLCLQWKRQLADLVKQYRTVVSELEEPGTGRVRARKSTSRVAE
jgi:hypothetical protein